MRITAVDSFVLHVPVTGGHIEDSSHKVDRWGVPMACIETDDGIVGFGYTGTHAHLPTDKLIAECIKEAYGPLLIGEDPMSTEALWNKLYNCSPIRWVGRSGITHLALSAVDIALWDIRAKAAGAPLWKLLGGDEEKRIEAYNTDWGWLHLSLETLVSGCKRLVEEEGYNGVKIKVGSSDIQVDSKRIAAVRDAIGPERKLMVDANGKFDLPTALRMGKHLSDYDVVWFEEPLWFDDLLGHVRLASAIDTPIALGEQLYTLCDFANFVAMGAVHIVQADATRLAGVTEWLKVADLAYAHRLPVVPHVGDMAQVHLHLCIAHPACDTLEYIPWLKEVFEEPARVRNGRFCVPQMPGASTTPTESAIARFRVA